MYLLNKIKNVIRHNLEKNYFSSRLLYFRELANYLESKKNKNEVFLVYTNGKVGSSTIEASLDKHSDSAVFHVHHLNPNYLNGYEAFVQKQYFRKAGFSNHLWRSLLWRPQFIQKSIIGKKKTKIVIVWRDPIAKNISTFFQWINFSEDNSHYYFDSHQYEMSFKMKTPKDDLSSLIELFLEKFPHFIHENWINTEQNYISKTNYLDHEFDKDKNYQIIQKDNLEILTLKLESFSKEGYADVVGDFCDIPNFTFQNANLTSEKPKYKAYKKFLEQIEFSEEFINTIYQSDFCTHFYSPLELQNFREKWRKK